MNCDYCLFQTVNVISIWIEAELKYQLCSFFNTAAVSDIFLNSLNVKLCLFKQHLFVWPNTRARGENLIPWKLTGERQERYWRTPVSVCALQYNTIFSVTYFMFLNFGSHEILLFPSKSLEPTTATITSTLDILLKWKYSRPDTSPHVRRWHKDTVRASASDPRRII